MSKDKTTDSCSFCSKSKESVDKLIVGDEVSICSDCVILCQTLIEEEKIPAKVDNVVNKAI